MAVQDALRLAGGARRVTHRGSLALVADPLAEVDLAGRADQVVPLNDARVVRDLGRNAVVHHDDMLDRGQAGQVLREQRQQRTVDEERFVLGVIGRVDELVGRVAQVAGVQDAPGARDREVQLQVPRGVPRERADPCVGREPETIYGACQ